MGLQFALEPFALEYPGMVRGYVVVRFRNALNLDEPKYVTGGREDDVVSNWSYPPEARR
jgi:hypothetical protein